MIFDCGAVLLFKFMLCLLLLLLYLWLFVAASVTQPNYSTSEHVLKTCYRKIALWPSLCGGISAGVDVDVNRGTRACKNNVKCFYVGGENCSRFGTPSPTVARHEKSVPKKWSSRAVLHAKNKIPERCSLSFATRHVPLSLSLSLCVALLAFCTKFKRSETKAASCLKTRSSLAVGFYVKDITVLLSVTAQCFFFGGPPTYVHAKISGGGLSDIIARHKLAIGPDALKSWLVAGRCSSDKKEKNIKKKNKRKCHTKVTAPTAWPTSQCV